MMHLSQCLDRLIATRTVEHIAVRVGMGEQILCDRIRSACDLVLTEHTLFDMASVTKILCTTMLALIAIDRGLLSPAHRVARYIPVPPDRYDLTVQHLLTHTCGIGHKDLCQDGIDRKNVALYIPQIPLDIPLGSDVRYSCPGFIMLGKIMEQIFELPLEHAFAEYVTAPLEMHATGFCPDGSLPIVNANQAPHSAGTVNDYNCRHLGGVAGNAGVFSNLADMTRFTKMLLAEGTPLISRPTFATAVQNHTTGMSESRGLGFLYVDGRYTQTADLFPTGSIGHCGHTGQSLFLHPNSGLYVIILSDATLCSQKKNGKTVYSEVMQMRHDVHAAIKKDLDAL